MSDEWTESGAAAPLLPADDSASATTSPLEIHEVERQPRGFPTLCLILTPIAVLLPLLFVLASLLPPPPRAPPSQLHQPDHLLQGHGSHRAPTAPTLLSFVDGSGRLLDARRNELHRQLQRGEIRDDWRASDGLSESPWRLQASTHQIEFGQQLRIAWRQVQRSHPSFRHEGDIVMALHCPADYPADTTSVRDAATLDQVRATHFYHNPTTSADTNSQTASQIHETGHWIIPSFPLVRADSCRFAMYRKHQQQPHDNGNTTHYYFSTLAITGRISLAAAQQVPTAIHLGLASDPDARFIQFSTGVAGKPVVELAKQSRHPNKGNKDDAEPLQWTKLTGSTTTYSANDMCQSPANDQNAAFFLSPGYLHTVKAVRLDTDSHYVYRAGLAMGQGVRWSEYFEFRTDPAVVHDPKIRGGTAPPLLTFLALGDQGCEQRPHRAPTTSPSYSSHRTLDVHVRPGDAAARDVADLITSIVRNQTVSSIHHIGDLSYANGAGHLWDVYMSMIQPYASRVPVVVAVGNHEYDHTDGGDNGKDPSGVMSRDGFQPYWGDFGNDSGGECGIPLSKRFSVPENGNGVYWYAFEQPLVHTIVLSSEHNLTADSQQYSWLNQDLQSVNRTATPWLIVEMHRPMYDKYQQDDSIAVAMQYEIEDLLYEHNVDIVLSAHFHSYLRTCDGLFRGKCNNGGPMHITVGTGGAPLDGGGRHASSPWIEKYDTKHWGVGKASVFDGSSMRWEFVVLGGEVEDEILITRNRR